MTDHEQPNRKHYSFMIEARVGGTSYILTARSLEDKNDWMKILTRKIDEIQRSTKRVLIRNPPNMT
jgi:hypothetical protein